MKNADDMLTEIIKTVDTNRDGKIQYEGTTVHSWEHPSLARVFNLDSKAC